MNEAQPDTTTEPTMVPAASPTPAITPMAEPAGILIEEEKVLFPEIPASYGILRNGSLYYPVCGNRLIPLNYQTNPLLDCADCNLALRFHGVAEALASLKRVATHKTECFGVVDRSEWPTV